MPHPLLQPPFSFINTFFFLSFFFLPTYLSSDYAKGYKACEPFRCGNISNISYPFWSSNQQDYCGLPKFKVDCQQDNLTIDINSQKFQIINITQESQTLQIARLDLLGDTCPKKYINVNLDSDFFKYTSNDEDNYTLLYDCGPLPYAYSGSLDPSLPFTCLIDGDPHDSYLVPSKNVVNFIPLGCKNNITVPVPKEVFQSAYTDRLSVDYVLHQGFEVRWSGVDGDKCDSCIKSGGRCGFNASINEFLCLCLNQQDYGETCSKSLAVSPLTAPTSLPKPRLPQLPPHSPANEERSNQSKNHDYYSECKKQSYNCGRLSNIPYPFWGRNQSSYCGGGEPFKLTCQDDHNTTIQIGSQNFTVLDIEPDHYTMRMEQTELAEDVCSPDFNDDTTWSLDPLRYPKSVHNITIFYDCSPHVDSSSKYFNFSCQDNIAMGIVGLEDEPLPEYSERRNCGKHIQVPTDAPEANKGGGLDDLQQVLKKGFQMNYNFLPECITCLTSGGACGSDNTPQHHFSCYPPPHKIAGKFSWERKLILGGATMITTLLMVITIIFCFRCKSSMWRGNLLLIKKSNQDIEAFLRNHGAQISKRYKFSDVKKMTNSFKVKLGQGGFGAVYKGKLLDGRLVAVKMLKASKRNGEEFINEVASISRTSHINVVALLGFCLEGSKRVLIYEFMPNGSLDKFIYKKELETSPTLGWNVLYQIAIGIARGLEYLHRGCNTRILHFDIKPHNILLDENFCPKISDFGLAKLCPWKESIISMSDARGTIGYVAPEVWNRHFGGVSHKSDVYSYGMMLLEMVGERKNINAEASHTSEIYFPHWIYKRLEQGIELRSDEVMSIEENEMIKKMIVVGLWCIQTIPNDRPTIRTVIDMLESSNTLEMPPKPLLSSPLRSVPESSTSLN